MRRASKSLRAAILAVSALIVLGAFAGGLAAWQNVKMQRLFSMSSAFETGEDRQAEAMRLFDEAVRARREERAQEALDAVTAARQTDPQLRSVDVLIGEIALEQKDPEVLRRAAKYALERGENESSANLLSALEAWMRRGEQGAEKAGQLAEQFLSDAAKAEPSNASVYFFHGELSRLLGDGRKAHRYLVAALYRQQPWRSSALLENKTQLAARESADRGKTVAVAPPSEQAEAVLALRDAASSSASANALAELLRVIPTTQISALLDDFALSGFRALMQGESPTAPSQASIPYLGSPASEASK